LGESDVWQPAKVATRTEMSRMYFLIVIKEAAELFFAAIQFC